MSSAKAIDPDRARLLDSEGKYTDPIETIMCQSIDKVSRVPRLGCRERSSRETRPEKAKEVIRRYFFLSNARDGR